MREILDLNNVEPADYDYPYGRVKNISAPGAADGTPVNEALVGDVVQFINKMMDEGGVVPNGLPDNEYSGFQIYEALEKLSPDIRYKGGVRYDDGNDLPVTNISSTFDVANFSNIAVEIEIVSNPYSNSIVSLGSEMPVGTTVRVVSLGSMNPVNFDANSTNAGGNPTIKIGGNTTANQTFSVDQNGTVEFTRHESHWFAIGDIVI